MDVYEELGLTKNENKAYQALVESGKLGASEVSAESGVPYSRVYDVLSSLAHKGLVEVVPGKAKKFMASSPEVFLKLIDDKEKLLKEAREKVKEMKQFYDKKDKNPVIMGQGQRAFYSIVKEMKEPVDYCYNIKWTSEYRGDWVEFRKKKLRRGIDVRDLSRYDKETKKNVDEWLKITKSIKKIENDGIAFSVLDDEEVMIGLIKSNVTLLIRDKPFAKLMKKMFLETYKSAEAIK
jgi:sugar-specific transcriptional regulator TrmB